MAKQYITNNHTSPLSFAVAGSSDPKILAPGETDNFELADPNALQIRAWKHVSMILVSDKKPDAADKPVDQPYVVPDETARGGGIGAAGGLVTAPTSAPAPAKIADAQKSGSDSKS